MSRRGVIWQLTTSQSAHDEFWHHAASGPLIGTIRSWRTSSSRVFASVLLKSLVSPGMAVSRVALIRELENFIERAVIFTRGKSIEAPLGELDYGIRSASCGPRMTVPW